MNATHAGLRANLDAMIQLVAVCKHYPGGAAAVRDLDLAVPRGMVCVLVGPSGCGKTTTLRMVNRLVEPSSGQIVVDGEDVTRVDPVALRRRVGYVIQQVGLFPHQTVADNIATVPRLLGWSRGRTRARVGELLELVGLTPGEYARRYPHELSGGQQQRVGVARALAADPAVLLMDEPFSAVDPVARQRLQAEFLRLQYELRKTVVFVTHDLDEAVRIGDRIAVLSPGGRLEQYADPASLLGAPATPFVADFLGEDRALRQLAVTPISADHLEHPPAVSRTTPLAEAVRILRGDGARWAVVLGSAGELCGVLPRDAAAGGAGGADEVGGVSGVDGVGGVGERLHRRTASVQASATLREAFAAMMRNDTGWVAVLEGTRYLGILTPESIHAALRRATPTHDRGHVDEPAGR